MWSKVREDWGVWLVIAWTVIVAGVLIIWVVYVALSPDNGYVSNGTVEVFSVILALGVWMFGLFVGLILWFSVAFLRDHLPRAPAR